MVPPANRSRIITLVRQIPYMITYIRTGDPQFPELYA
jgi:hypothetical protein